jgi:uncharacterized protein (TIGR02996 family)
VTTEDDFQRALDADPQDWHTRLVFADWLDDRDDPRAAGYRAIAALQRYPLQGHHSGLQRQGWWWHCSPEGTRTPSHNDIPADWFTLLPTRYGNKSFWPLHKPRSGVRTRRQCEDALALVFRKLPMERQTAILAEPIPFTPNPARTRKRKPARNKPKSTRTASRAKNR